MRHPYIAAHLHLPAILIIMADSDYVPSERLTATTASDTSSDIEDQTGMNGTTQPPSHTDMKDQVSAGESSSEVVGNTVAQRTEGPQPAKRVKSIHHEMSKAGSLFRFPQDIVEVKVNGVVFKVYKAVLENGSAYWDKIFNGPWRESKGEVDLGDDVHDTIFGVYLDVATHMACLRERLTSFQQYDPDNQIGLLMALNLWRAGDYFMNQKMVKLAEMAIEMRLGAYTRSRWIDIYRSGNGDEAAVLEKGRYLEQCYKLCCKYNMVQVDGVLTAVASAPPRIYRIFTNQIGGNFMMQAGCHANERADAFHRKAELQKPEPEPTRAAKRTRN